MEMVESATISSSLELINEVFSFLKIKLLIVGMHLQIEIALNISTQIDCSLIFFIS